MRLSVMQAEVMKQFDLASVSGDTLVEIYHNECRQYLRDANDDAIVARNIWEAYEAAENHLLEGCHSDE